MGAERSAQVVRHTAHNSCGKSGTAKQMSQRLRAVGGGSP